MPRLAGWVLGPGANYYVCDNHEIRESRLDIVCGCAIWFRKSPMRGFVLFSSLFVLGGRGVLRWMEIPLF